MYFGEAAWRRLARIQRTRSHFNCGVAVLAEQGAGSHIGGSGASGGITDAAFTVMLGTVDRVSRNAILRRRHERCA